MGSLRAVGRSLGLVAGAALLLSGLCARPALATGCALTTNSTWTGSLDGNYANTANWNNGCLPGGGANNIGNVGIGTLGAAATTALSLPSGTFGVGTLQITSDANPYTLTMGTGASLYFSGSGIVNQSSTPLTLNIQANSVVGFINSSSAGNTIINLTPNVTAGLVVTGTSSAGTAQITNNGGVITFGSGGSAGDTATAANASIVSNSGQVVFQNFTTAGNATITMNGGFLTFLKNSTAGTARLVTNAGAVTDVSVSAGPSNDGKLTAGSIEGAGLYYLGSRQLTVGANNLSTTVSGVISDCGTGTQCGQGAASNPSPAVGPTGGALVKVGTGTLTLTGANTYTGGTTVNAGTLQIGAGGTTGSIVGNVTNNATLAFNRSDNIFFFSGVISGTGAVQQIGPGTLVLSGANTYTGGTLISNGILSAESSNSVGSGIVTLDGGTFLTGALSVSFANGFALNAKGGTIGSFSGSTLTLTGVIANGNGSGALRIGGSVVTLTGVNTYTGATIVDFGILALSGAGSIAASSGVTLVESTSAFDISGASAGVSIQSLSGLVASRVVLGGNTLTITQSTGTFDGVITGTGGLTLAGGSLILTGANTYTGATTITGGTLILTGSPSSRLIGSLTSPVTVAAGGTLSGIGTLNPPAVPQFAPGAGPAAAPALLTVNGTLLPGGNAGQPGALTVNGNVVFGAGATFQAGVLGAAAGQLIATGSASLAGTLSVVPLGGPYTFNSAYTLLSATGGVTGTFNAAVQSGFGAGVTPTVSYTGTSVLLTLTPAPLTPLVPPTPTQTPTFGPVRPQNPGNVASGIDRAVLVFGANATPLFTLYNLPAGQTAVGVNALSGEVHTSVAAMGVDEGSGFLRVMLDPFAVGRGAGVSPTLAYADSAIVNPALGAVDQAADLAGPAPLDARRFAVWGAAFGSTGHTNGDGTIGSSRRQLSDANLAVGVDVRLDPQTMVGFAAAGGGAHASLDNGLGSASADVWQIGAYVMRKDGPWSLGGAIAYSWLGVDTTRQVFVLAVPSLSAHTTAHGFSGRIEGAYEVAQWAGLAIAPFAAFEGHAVNAPGFLETNFVGAPIGLAGSSHTNTTTRTELGVKLDGKAVWGGMDVTSFAKLAWAHYFDRDALLNASLVGFAGSNFTVLGARPDRDSALLSAGLDVKLAPTISLGGRVDGELSGNVAQVSGSARLRVSF